MYQWYMTARTNYISTPKFRKKNMAANHTLLKPNFCYFNNVLLKKVVKLVIKVTNYRTFILLVLTRYR
jgi:acyl-CoA thioesterase FadM